MTKYSIPTQKPVLILMRKIKLFTSTPGPRQRYPLSLLSRSMVLERLANTIQQDKGIRHVNTEKKEIRLSLFSDDMKCVPGKPKRINERTIINNKRIQ